MPDLADTQDTKVSRREVFGISSATLAARLAVAGGNNADAQTQRLHNHNAPNETDPGPQNLPLAAENPDSEWRLWPLGDPDALIVLSARQYQNGIQIP